jgi:solute carrier family 35 protein C2
MPFSGEAYAYYCGALYATAASTHIIHRCKPRCLSTGAIEALDVGRFIISWYAISISMTMFNKYLFVHWKGGFNFPIAVSTMHVAIKLVLSRIAALWSSERQPVPWRLYCLQAVPIGFCTGIDIALSNAAFLFVSVHFYTICKSGSVIWVLLFSLCFGLQKFQCKLIGVVLLIALGIGTASFGEVDFVFNGFLLVILAGLAGGFRWALTQLFLKSLGEKNMSSIDLVYHISPASAVSLLPPFFMFESDKFFKSPFMNDSEVMFEASLLAALGGFIAFALILVEVKLVEKSSSLTLAVAGNFKDVLQIALSVAIFAEKFTTLNALGLCCAIAGIAMYSSMKREAATSEEKEAAKKEKDRKKRADMQQSQPLTFNNDDNHDAGSSDAGSPFSVEMVTGGASELLSVVMGGEEEDEFDDDLNSLEDELVPPPNGERRRKKQESGAICPMSSRSVL